MLGEYKVTPPTVLRFTDVSSVELAALVDEHNF
jgi:hypothetical protein